MGHFDFKNDAATVTYTSLDQAVIHTKQWLYQQTSVTCDQDFPSIWIEVNPEQGTNAYGIGVIGGMGPAASVLFMEKLRNAELRHKKRRRVIIAMASALPPRIEAIVSDDPKKKELLRDRIQTLNDTLVADLGPHSQVAMPCNTAHYFAPRSPHFVNMIDAFIDHIGDSPVVVLATNATINSHLFSKIPNVRFPTGAILDALMDVIWGVKTHGVTHALVRQFLTVLTHFSRQGHTQFGMCCTELPVIVNDPRFKEHVSIDYHFIDPMDCVINTMCRRR